MKHRRGFFVVFACSKMENEMEWPEMPNLGRNTPRVQLSREQSVAARAPAVEERE